MARLELSADCKQWLDEQENEFMKPYCDYFNDDPNQDPTEEPRRDDQEPGYYSRLSAPGYMDCTDWIGPFPSAEEALEALYDQYGE